MFPSNKIKVKINGFPKESEYNKMPFGRQIEFQQKIKEFKSSAKIGHLATKRKSVASALKEFIDLYNVTEYYFIDTTTPDYKDDSIQIYYK